MSAPLESPQFSRRQFFQAAAAVMATAGPAQAAKSTTRPNIAYRIDIYATPAAWSDKTPAIMAKYDTARAVAAKNRTGMFKTYR